MSRLRQNSLCATQRSRSAAALALLLALAVGCASALPNASVPITIDRDLAYVQRGDRSLGADVYTPSGHGPFPAVLLVHGGSWKRGNKQRMARIAERLAQRGYVAVSIDYRLAPEDRFPAQLYDCQAAVRWMRTNAERLRLDPARIAGFGYSAGAHLVALLATANGEAGLVGDLAAPAPDTRLQAAVLGAAPVDVAGFPTNAVFESVLGASLAERPDLYALASPLRFVTPDDPPIFLYHGADDWMVDASQSHRMLDALERAHVPTGYLEVPGGHLATFWFDEEPVRRAIDFLDRWM
jgi:acetyl esterase/lipase